MTDTTTRPAPIPDGIYFGLSDEAYHADLALGSTGLKKLLSSPPDYWWQSPMNPLHEPEESDTPSKRFGKALHRCVLEGQHLFVSEYAPTDLPGNTKEGKAEKERIEAAGMKPLKRDDYNRILGSAAFIKANPNLGAAFTNGMPEVSVFWTADGVRKKSRFDFLKLNAIVDLKSIRNPRGKVFQKACRDAIAEYDYILSAEHYCDGRRQMARLVSEGRVYGDHDAEWLARVAQNEMFAFVLVFWQAESSPISHGFKLSPGNPLFLQARSKIEVAIAAYKRFLAEFGENAAWMLAEPIDEIQDGDLPAWWVAQQQIYGA